MKTFKFLVTLVMAVVCVSLSSCSKDDENSAPTNNSLDINLLYGTWIREYKGYNGDSEKEILVFNSNGTWNRTQVVNGNKEREEGHTFSYYKDARVLALKDDEADNEPTGYTIIELSDKTFIWLDDENLFTYTRQN